MKPSNIATGFDRLAPVYTGLTKLVFGNSLDEAQEYFLKILKPADRVLILGGGSGKFLKSLLKLHPHICIDYIDISPRMIALAKQKTGSSANVNFIVGTEQNIPNTHYSVVITNFYLDLFSDKTLKSIIERIKSHLQPEALWLATDFVSEKWWRKIMLWVMYRFFRITTGIEARQLPDWPSVLHQAGLVETDSQKFYRGFIKAAVYTKTY